MGKCGELWKGFKLTCKIMSLCLKSICCNGLKFEGIFYCSTNLQYKLGV